MRAALGTAYTLIDSTPPAPRKTCSHQRPETLLGLGTNWIGRIGNRHLDILHDKIAIDRDPNQHLMHDIAWFPNTSRRLLVAISLGIDNPALDVEQTVITGKAVE